MTDNAETNNRMFKILGAAWLGLGSLSFAIVFINLFPLVQGKSPSGLFESGDGWWIVDLVFLVVGAIGMVNGLALLRRNPAGRPLLAISSLVLLLPSAGLFVPLLVVAPSLWLTLSRGGKEALGSYMARENG